MALNILKEKKVKGLVIDLRNNPGGLVLDTVRIADLLEGEGVILETGSLKNSSLQFLRSIILRAFLSCEVIWFL